MPKTLIIKLDIKNSEAESDIREAVSAVPDFFVSTNGSARCDVLFLEIGYDHDKEFRAIEQVLAKGLARQVFLTSKQKDPDLLLRALKTGVKEFFSQPVNTDEIIHALRKFKRSMPEQTEEIVKKGVVITVLGSKGGVGSTTTAVNLAVSLKEAEPNKSVVLMDMNPLLGGVHVFLDLNPGFSWADGAKDIGRIDSTYLFHTLHKHSSGVYVLPAPVRPAGLDAATPETMEQLLTLMRSSFDVIVMDGCRSFDDLSLKMLALSNTILVVAELTLLSIVNAKKLLETFEGVGISYGKDIRIVINRHHKKTQVSPQEAEQTLGRKIAVMLDNDYETTLAAINTGKTISETGLNAGLTKKFRTLAEQFLDKAPIKKSGLSFGFIGDQITNVTEKLNVIKHFKFRTGIAPRREVREKEETLL